MEFTKEELEVLDNFAKEQGLEKQEDQSEKDYYKLLAEKAEEFSKTQKQSKEDDDYVANMKKRALKALMKSQSQDDDKKPTENHKTKITFDDLTIEDRMELKLQGIEPNSKKAEALLKEMTADLAYSGEVKGIKDYLNSPIVKTAFEVIDNEANTAKVIDDLDEEEILKTRKERLQEFKSGKDVSEDYFSEVAEDLIDETGI